MSETLATIIAAAAGAVVAKHGGKASSSRSGASDVLGELCVKVGVSPEAAALCGFTIRVGERTVAGRAMEREALATVDADYDVVLVDCPPALSMRCSVTSPGADSKIADMHGRTPLTGIAGSSSPSSSPPPASSGTLSCLAAGASHEGAPGTTSITQVYT